MSHIDFATHARDSATSSPSVPDIDPRHDALKCARITNLHARTFSLASKLLPGPKRRAAYALYAFCRTADDLLDRAEAQSALALTQELNAYRQALQAALDGRPSSAVFRELAWVVQTYRVSPAPLFELLDGVSRDLISTTYESWDELERYCEGVASSVGEMCTYVFGVPAGGNAQVQAVQYARTLGTAMQLTNILRDVGEDAQRGRCYLPADDLAQFGLTPADVLSSPRLVLDARWQAFMQFEVARARIVRRIASGHRLVVARLSTVRDGLCHRVRRDLVGDRRAQLRHHHHAGTRGQCRPHATVVERVAISPECLMRITCV